MGRVRNAAIYLLSTFTALRLRPSIATLGFALRYAMPCLRLFKEGPPDVVDSGKPWMCFPAVSHLDRLIRSDFRVFEYGSGSSTLYLAPRVGELHSVEHDADWYQRVHKRLVQAGHAKVDLALHEPKPAPGFDRSRIADPLAYVSDDSRTVGKSFEDYARAIDRFPDGYFDLVIVDGRARPSCLMHAMPKVSVGGVLLLDQSERSYYLQAMESLLDPRRWGRVRYMAPLPHSLHFTEASFFTRLPT